VDSALLAIDNASSSGPGGEFLWTEEALRDDERWERAREAARSALRDFAEMGVAIPSLSDPDFNVGRRDAP
jgi:hypothetical protein